MAYDILLLGSRRIETEVRVEALGGRILPDAVPEWSRMFPIITRHTYTYTRWKGPCFYIACTVWVVWIFRSTLLHLGGGSQDFLDGRD